MSGREAPAAALAEPRRMRLVLALLCCFTLYGSFIPFHFTVDPRVVRAHLATLQLYPFQDGRKNFSIPDVASNVILFVPFGLLLAAGGLAGVLGPGRARRVAVCGGYAAVLATATEFGQLFTLDRTASGTDVMANVVGAALGAAAWGAAPGWFQGSLREGLERHVRRAPSLLPLGLLAVAFMADRVYPFAVTLDVSTGWHNLTHAQVIPFASFRRRFWADILMDNAVTPALLAGLLRNALERAGRPAAAGPGAWAGTVLFAGALEVGKLFFQGRIPNVDNVILAGVGGIVGVTAIPWLARCEPVRRRRGGALLALALFLLTYAELTPFHFALSAAGIAAKAQRIEWLPLWSYYGADAQSAVFDLWNKLLLSGFLGFALLATRARHGPASSAAVAGLWAGGLLECAQILTTARTPSVTDVMILGVGAYLGGRACLRYHAWREGPGAPPRASPATGTAHRTPPGRR